MNQVPDSKISPKTSQSETVVTPKPSVDWPLPEAMALSVSKITLRGEAQQILEEEE